MNVDLYESMKAGKMKTIALIAQKGGTGKTTLALSLAVVAQQMGRQVLVVDLDAQASACKWADRRADDSILVIDAQPARLANALRKAEEGGIDFAIIDTPGKSEEAALAAAKAADLVLIALKPQIIDIETIPNTQAILQIAGNIPAMVVFNQVPPTREGAGGRYEEAAKAAHGYGISVFPYYVCNRVDFGDAGVGGQGATEYRPDGRAAEEIRLLYKYTIKLLDNNETIGERKYEETRSRSSAV
jgi:chromosome partitioning protein